MSIPRYAKYKESGVEWLGAVPEHWSIRKVRWLCEIKKRIAGKLGYDVLSITQQGIKIKDIESNDGQLSMDYSKYQFVEIGDFAMNHMDLLTGYVDISNVFGVTSPDYRVFSNRNTRECHDKYLLYIFQMGYRNRIFYAYGQGSSQLGRWRLPTEQFKNLPFPLPQKSEQVSIVALLDQETAKIDALVAEQQRLIELLKEKRQAVISHAVTKGLNPKAPMKPSGIEWLGDVPVHWGIERIKQSIASAKNGIWGEEAQQDENDIPCVRVADFDRQKLRVELSEPTIRNISESERVGRALRQGDLLLEKSGGGENQPVGCVVLYDDPRPAVCSNFVARVQIAEGMNASFWRYIHAAAYAVRLNTKSIKQTSGIQNLDAQQYFDEKAGFPPPFEQSRIAAFLDNETSKLDTLTAEAQCAIDLLQERRTALISAAVTGKIDVRGIASSEAT